jgi:hypothetical protein
MTLDDGTDFNFFEFFHRVVEANSPITLMLVSLGAVTLLVGGNVLVAMHYRRVGKSIWSGFKPFAFPFKDFNRWEWLWFGLLAVVALTLMGLGIELNQR